MLGRVMIGLLGLTLPFADMPSPLASWLLAGAAVVIIGIAKSGFGSGVGIVAVPMFVFAFGDSPTAMGALLPLLIAADILSVYHHWGTWDKANLRALAPGTFVGLLLGAIVLWWLIGMPVPPWSEANRHATSDAERNMKIAIGVICLLYVLGDQIKARFAPGFRFKPTLLGGSITGISAGVVTTIAHAAGPVVTIFLLGQHIAKQQFIGTAVIYFFTVNVIKQLSVYPFLGMTNTDTLWAGLWLVPLVPLGTWLGLRLNRIMSERAFRLTILIIVAISGVQLVFGINPISLLSGSN